jgi:hypothetical protein
MQKLRLYGFQNKSESLQLKNIDEWNRNYIIRRDKK